MAASRSVEDACRRTLTLPSRIQRVVSLCPSISETVVELAPGCLVGRTRYCTHPDVAMQAVPTVGGTKNPDIAAILALKPDLIIAEKEENRREDVERLAEDVPVYVFDVRTMDDAVDMLRTLGDLLGAETASRALAERIAAARETLRPLAPSVPVLYLIWRKPWMAAAKSTYINSVLAEMGLDNVLRDYSRYPELDAAALATLKPAWVLLSSEPYPFTEAHLAEVQALFPDARVSCVDGEWFSWYGARMQIALPQLQSWLRDTGPLGG